MEPNTATARELETSDLEETIESVEVPSEGDPIHLHFAAQDGWEIDRDPSRGPRLTNGDYTLELGYIDGMFKVSQVYGPGDEVPSLPEREGPKPYSPPF